MNSRLALYLFITSVFATLVKMENIKSHPYQAILKYKEKPFCGGTIISNRHVLTAAHCLAGRSKDFPNMIVTVGTELAEEKTNTNYLIYRLDVHPKYTGKLVMPFVYLYDIAVITIKNTIKFGETVKSIELTKEDVKAGDSIILSGWGIISFTQKSFSNELISTSLSIINNSKCSAILSATIYNDQFCTFSKNSIKKCPGDSGGPVVKDGKLVGVGSHAVICQKNVPDVYTSVYHSLRFIDSILKS